MAMWEVKGGGWRLLGLVVHSTSGVHKLLARLYKNAVGGKIFGYRRRT